MRILTRVRGFNQVLSRAKVLLIFLSAILIVANLYLLSATRDLARSYNEQQNQATWYLFQLTKEFSELKSTTLLAEKDHNYIDKVLLKYELTWSRFDLLLNNRESESLISLPGAESFFESLFHQFQTLEPKLKQFQESGDPALNLSQDFEHQYMLMIHYINTNFRVKSPLYQSQMQLAQALTHAQFVLMILLFACVGIVSYIIHKEAVFHKQASVTDSLTGIPNRLAFMYQLTEYIEEKTSFSLILLDLDGFKKINDSHGHQAGDLALRIVSARLIELMSQYQLSIYRIGGDEFSVLTTQTDKQEIDALIQTINHCFDKSITLQNQTVQLSASIGVASYPYDTTSLNQLISMADQNMYNEKFSTKSDEGNVFNLKKR
ncbi:GGDEF domain-containing protein [Vibrio sp. Isolate25]|uniref:GGDEF domain-containing protein n=1 Tax=unclassified Vibrio TaxID=2614977 RepID=UPI001EFEC917|nr:MULTISPECIES: GGDEF domain-containing protein [unclassified Vibrio]MCG9596203.1 GGDEF domain-containing protein [Vibrio sp. Isolate25]MCG9676765.1 GGDEF domain-containing protein [Vibrio sp. Isolate24]